MSNRKNINYTKTTVDGIKFASKLEAYMYTLLVENGFEPGYESETFILMEDYAYEYDSYEYYRTREMKNSKGKRVQGVTYTPDFVGDDYIIEVKGRANEVFPLRWKMFKKYISENRPGTTLYMPKNDKDCQQVIELLKKSRE